MTVVGLNYGFAGQMKLDEVTGGVDLRSIPGLVALVRELNAAGTALVVIAATAGERSWSGCTD